jgi:hypothetical protein
MVQSRDGFWRGKILQEVEEVKMRKEGGGRLR